MKGFEERLAWLDRKGTGYGFNIITVDVLPMQPVYGTYHSTGREQMKHQGVGYKGILEITHSTLFRKGFLEGIGPAKAYGFGMLMLLRRVAD